MPIAGKPLLEIWLDILDSLKIKKILVNLHYKPELVLEFLKRPKFKDRIETVFENKLLGTAGTLRENYSYFKGRRTLLIHGDNLCICKFANFIDYHFRFRAKQTLITMMTFRTSAPQTCGIVELDSAGIVQKFHEKVKNPPGNLANAAIYLLEPEVLEWINDRSDVSDFSTQLLPFFLGKIATWNNSEIMRDIGSPESLRLAQKDVTFQAEEPLDDWQINYKKHPIHNLIFSKV